MPFSVAILGAGYIADWHCRALRGVRVVAVCDRDAGRARRLADRYHIPRTFTDLAALLADAKPDVVHDPDRLTAEADRLIELPTGAPFYRRWRARAHVGETVVDLNWSFEAGFPEHVIHVRGTAGSATADIERGVYVLRRADASGLEDADRYAQTAGEGKSLVRQARANFARYVLSKFKLSRRGSLFGTSIARSLAA